MGCGLRRIITNKINFSYVISMYTYGNLIDDIKHLKSSGIETGIIGKSELGLDIPYIHVGDYFGDQIIITGAIHARENITALLVMKQAFYYAFSANNFDGGVYFIPMLNPDGAVLIEGESRWKCFGESEQRRIARAVEINGGSRDFSLWKANINGVDLNNNFDARFGKGAGQVDYPASQGYMGEQAFSEKESAALGNFTLRIRPSMTISYHAKGREVYWEFFQKGEAMRRDFDIARRVARHLGYLRVDGDLASSGGYKDWCIDRLGLTALTIEIIDDRHEHPLDSELLDEDLDVNLSLLQLLAGERKR